VEHRKKKAEKQRKEAEQLVEFQKKKQQRELEEQKGLEICRWYHPGDWIAGIPALYKTYTLENYLDSQQHKTIVKRFASEYPYTKSLFLSGSPGSGKTHLAVAAVLELIRKNKINDDAKIITVPEFLLEIKNCFNHTQESELAVVEKYAKAPVLLLDDLGVEKASEFAIQSLYVLIDRRYREQQPTIITTNLTLPAIEKHLGSRIASRLSTFQIVKFEAKDYRRRRQYR
jgi:DNA replication protein DnaC